MKFNKKYLVFCLLPIILLQGCSSTSPSFSDMSQSYQSLLEKYNLNSALLNVVRASQYRPLSFLAIPSITGTGSLHETAGLGANILSAIPGSVTGFLSAGAGTYYTGGIEATLGKSFTFTQSSMDNAEFSKKILTPISIETINYLNNRHINKELLFSLTLSSIEIKHPNQDPVIYNNYPDSRSYGVFQDQLSRLIKLGLSTQLLEKKEPVGPLMPEVFRDKEILDFLDAKSKYRLSLEKVSSKNGVYFQVYQTMERANLCFMKNEYAQEVKAEFGDQFFCFNHFGEYDKKSQYIALNESTTRDNDKTLIRFVSRSTHEIFDYLGAILRAQVNTPENNPGITRKTSAANNLAYQDGKMPIFVIEKNNTQSKKLAIITYNDETYSIPDENNGYSTLVINILSQLLALSRVPGSIPPSPAILIK